MNIDFEKMKGLSTEALMSLSAIVDKMDIGQELKNMVVDTGNEERDNEEIGKQLIVLLITKLHKAKEEVYEFISQYKGITIEEAKKVNSIEIIKEVLSIDGTSSFLS